MSNNSERMNQLSPVKRALLAVEEMQAKLEDIERIQREPIAIIGMGCRLAGGVTNLKSFWQLLHDGVDAITEVPPDRWDAAAYYDPDPDKPGKMATCWGSFVNGVDQFDAAFFGISPREAMSMDPQQRLLLEVTWEALEHAGQVPEQLAGSQTGVFVGVLGCDYTLLQFSNPLALDTYSGTGTSHNIVAGRISYLLDLRGPCVALDTACSSSLVALHLACQSLRKKECDMALTAGINLILSPLPNVATSKMRLMAQDGRCKPFDAQADGIVRGEGCGVVVLKRLSDAVADGDPILALIRGSAVNQDGHSSGLTAPNPLAQQQLIQQALKNAGVSPQHISYVEAHGTGTSLGDPIEVEALSRVIGKPRADETPCFLGSIKANIGHLEAAAGVIGLIKVVLALQHQEIPPQLHFHTLNPNITLDGTPFVIPTQPTPWKVESKRRLAGVSSFGWGGTNAHVVLEEAPDTAVEHIFSEQTSAAGQAYVMPLSASTSQALRDLAMAYYRWLMTDCVSEAGTLHDICYTASLRRNHYDQRLAVIGRSPNELAEHLLTFLQAGSEPDLVTNRVTAHYRPKLVFVFPGLGSQWIGMGRQLLEQEPIFRQSIARCEEAMRPHVAWSLQAVLTEDEQSIRLAELDVIQPVLFALQVSLATLWRSWGITPDAVIGHSMGEIAAAYIAGTLTLDDAVRIICRRSHLLLKVRGQGATAVVGLSVDQCNALLEGYTDCLSIAVSNGPFSTVISGDRAALDEVLQKLVERDIFYSLMKMDVASHSPQMDPLRPELLQLLEEIKPDVAQIPIYSTVKGRIIDGTEMIADYWVHNLRDPVLFWAMVQLILHEGPPATFLEISPHPILLPAIKQGLGQSEQEETGLLPSLYRDEVERTVLLRTLGALYTRGHLKNWSKFYSSGGKCLHLPAYVWQHQRFWLDDQQATQHKGQKSLSVRQRRAFEHPLLGKRQNFAVQMDMSIWEMELDLEALPYLMDHRLYAMIVLPGAAYIEMALSASKQAMKSSSPVLEEVFLQDALVLAEGTSRVLQFVLTPHDSNTATFQVFSRPYDTSGTQDNWRLHAIGTVKAGRHEVVESMLEPITLTIAREHCRQQIDGSDYYRQVHNWGFGLGPSFQGVTRLWLGKDEVLGQVRLPVHLGEEASAYQIHPVLLDACFQILGATRFSQQSEQTGEDIHVPISVEKVQFYRHPDANVWCYARLRTGMNGDSALPTGDFFLFDEDGERIADVTGLHFLQVNQAAILKSLQQNVSDWLYEVTWKAQALGERSTSRPPVPSTSSWLILADRSGVGHALAEQLRMRGDACLLFYADELTKGENELAHKLQNLLESQHGRRDIVHLWSLDISEASNRSANSLLVEQETLGCGSILPLIQSLAQTAHQEDYRLWIVTRGAQPIRSHPAALAIGQAAVWGMGRVIAQEHSDLWGGLIDVDPTAAVEEAMNQVFMELQVRDKENQVAWRLGQRYVPRLWHNQQRKQVEQQVAIHSTASYLISGGLGGLGLVIAQWLIEQGARHLVLLGRSAPGLHQRAKIDALEAIGAQIVVVQADVTCEDEVSQVLNSIERSMPPLRGIVHAAGVLDDGFLVQQSWEKFARVLSPKIAGAWILHTLTSNLALDFFHLYSGGASLLGTLGQSNHAAANSFLDVLAHYRQARGLTAVSINWGAWAKVGGAATASMVESARQHGMEMLTPQQGTKTVEVILQLDTAQVAVLPINKSRWQDFLSVVESNPLFTDLIDGALNGSAGVTVSQHRTNVLSKDQLLAANRNDRQGMLHDYLCEMLARVLRLPSSSKPDTHQPLNTLGIDSMMAFEMRTRILMDLGIGLSIVNFLNGPNIEQITTQLLEQVMAEELFDVAGNKTTTDEDWEVVQL